MKNGQPDWADKHALKWKTYLRERTLKGLEHIRLAKDKPCMDCGRKYPSCAMDFDHVRGTKLANVCQMSSRSLKSIDEEIAKCDVVCANCHRIRTQARGEYRDYVKPIR